MSSKTWYCSKTDNLPQHIKSQFKSTLEEVLEFSARQLLKKNCIRRSFEFTKNLIIKELAKRQVSFLIITRPFHEIYKIPTDWNEGENMSINQLAYSSYLRSSWQNLYFWFSIFNMNDFFWVLEIKTYLLYSLSYKKY
jgi:hypothetical protein